MFRRLSLSAAILAATVAPAFAHLNPEEHGSFMAGVSHPLFGADHILAMVAVGLWASQIGGRGLWTVPAAFVSMMTLGFLMAVSGIALPFVEPAILASVVGLGLLVGLAVRLPAAASAAIVAVFALFHGHAHGGELGEAGALAFGAGFVVATVVLHMAGIGLGLVVGRFGTRIAPRITRGLGLATALAGVSLIFN